MIRATIKGRLVGLLLAGALLFSRSLPAQEAEELPRKPVDVEAASLPLRTALYHDPTLAPPLERLLQLYSEAGRNKELIDGYRQHVAQYPDDSGALIVLIRLLAAVSDPEAGRLVRAAATRFPEVAFLQYLLAEQLRKSHEPGTLDALDRAIARETLPARRRAWIDQLVPLAMVEGRPELAQRHLEALAAESSTAEGKLEAARKMITHKLHEPALAVLESAAAQKPSAETSVDFELAAASAELGLTRETAAASRLDRLLSRLAADYWRRTEILHRRTALVKSDLDREAMLGAARTRLKSAPNDPGAVLELAQLLAAFEFRREALDVLVPAAARLPASEKIEKAALDLFDLLRDERGREAFLAERLRAAPARQDLALARARSLFLLGRRSEALAVFDAFAERLDPAARLTQILEFARFLRRSSMAADAAALFERAVALAPTRLEVRRELAETWLAAGQKQKAREVFAGPLPETTETEALIEVIQFFLKQEMFAEARQALALRRAKEPQDFDLRIQEIAVFTRLADRAAGEKLIEETRALADTEARYRRWLETAVAFYTAFETEGNFLATEQERMLATEGGWAGEAGQRRMIFAEVAAAQGEKGTVAAMIAGALAGELPTEMRIELRRRQLAMVENDPAQATVAESQLEALQKEDAARAEEYRIRLALLAVRAQRQDRLQMLLGLGGDGIDVAKVKDATLLTGLENLLSKFSGGQSPLLARIVERLTVIDPANRGHWERWVSSLAIKGDEERLRGALQRVREGVDRIPVGETAGALLREHLLASYWRSVAELVDDDAPDSAQTSQALPLLDAAGRLAEKREESLWITWARAYLLNRLGRREARDEAIRELERVARLPLSAEPTPSETNPGQTDEIVFPDGLVIALGPARELLTTSPRPLSASTATSSGPRGVLKARWAFETDGRVSITKVVPLEGARLLVRDATGMLYVIDSASGKLAWSRPGPPSITTQANPHGGSGTVVSLPVPVAEGGRIFLPAGNAVECWSAEDGHLLWRAADLGGATVHPTLFFNAGQLLVCDVAQARLCALEAKTGKLSWAREYPRRAGAAPVNSSNSGASFSENRILLYGAATVIVSAETGDVLWSFDRSRAKPFPIVLSETAPSASPAFMGTRHPVWSGHFGGGQGFNVNFMAINHRNLRAFGRGSGLWSAPPGYQFALVNPAASWADEMAQGQPRFGLLHGSRLLLLSFSGARSVRLDLPFSSPTTSVNGTFVGLSGRSACFAAGSHLTFVDLDSGKAKSISTGSGPGEFLADGDAFENSHSQGVDLTLNAALDGPTVYVSEQSGISAYHGSTQQRIFRAPWPKAVAPTARPNAPGGQVNYTFQGRFRYHPNGVSAIETMTALVADGVFYTEHETGRLVALAGDGEIQPR